MVTCTKCGAENEEGAQYCVNCGASFYPEKMSRRREEECFGLPQGGAIAGIVFGAFIIIIGLSLAFGIDIGRWIGPFIMIVVGVLIVIGAIYGLGRKRS